MTDVAVAVAVIVAELRLVALIEFGGIAAFSRVLG